MIAPARIGLIGTGTISDIYLTNATTRFANLEIVAVADLVRERAEAQAAKYGIPQVLTVDELIASPEIDVILNLTIPAAHYEIARRGLSAGKHVYSEKPLALTPAEGRELVTLAAERGLQLGAAPDTFLGAGIQTCRRLIEEGQIGEVVGASACFASRGNENWHPNPGFSYQPGGGPIYNHGPYYCTALVALLGPVATVAGNSRISFPTRTISSQPLAGQTIEVTTPTFLNAVFAFASGPVATITATYDVRASERPRIEIYGADATLSVPDPNTFGGPVRIGRDRTIWDEIPLDPGFSDNSRALGLSEFVDAVAANRPALAGADLANHVLEFMYAIETAGDVGRTVALESTCDRPTAFDPATIALRDPARASARTAT